MIPLTFTKKTLRSLIKSLNCHVHLLDLLKSAVIILKQLIGC